MASRINKTGPKSNWKMDKQILHNLRVAFRIGCNITEACIYAGISTDTYYRWIKQNPELSDEFSELREWLVIEARQTISRALREGNVKIAKFYLAAKRREEFG